MERGQTDGQDLKPCPFCGCEATLERFRGDKAIVRCVDVDCPGNSYVDARGEGAYYDERVAVREWNRRAPTPRLYTAADVREAFMQGWILGRTDLSDVYAEDEAMRRYPEVSK